MLRAQQISDKATCRQAILAGQKKRAAAWLAQQSMCPEIAVLTALNHPAEPLTAWRTALALLEPLGASVDLLLSHRELAKLMRAGEDRTAQAQHLAAAAQIAKHLRRGKEESELLTILAVTEAALGKVESARNRHSDALREAVNHEDHLLIIVNGTVLCGMLMGSNQWEDAASVAVLVVRSCVHRHNWIGLASARLQRSTCALVRKQEQLAVELLLECGERLYQQGAVAALNLIKARLGELQQLLGRERLSALQQQAQHTLQHSQESSDGNHHQP